MNLQTQASSVMVMGKLGGKKSMKSPSAPVSIKKKEKRNQSPSAKQEDLYSMDLGTMGIPRDVAHLN